MIDAKQPLATNREITSLVQTFRNHAVLYGDDHAAFVYHWCANQLEAAINQVERCREAEEREGAKAVDEEWLDSLFGERNYDSLSFASWDLLNDWTHLRFELKKAIGALEVMVVSDGTHTLAMFNDATRHDVLHLLAALGMEKKP